jgi:RNA helicase HrpA
MSSIDPFDLPVYRQRARIVAALRDHPVVVVESPTGSGKTTQIPYILHKEGYADRLTIGVTQPRRLAAVSVSQFLARQMGTSIPDVVGYKMRFEDMTGPTTRIKIMTDGILLQEVKADVYLSRYSVIMVDEAHERSLNIDFTLGLLKRVMEHRPEFRVLVSSATINTATFSEYFDGAPVVSIDTPVFPIRVVYTPVAQADDGERRSGPPRWRTEPGGVDPVVTGVCAALEKAESEGIAGDALVFLSGEGTIKDCMAVIGGRRSLEHMVLLPLYAKLSKEEQDRVFQDYPGHRKVILATNIAETSLTIQGVTVVVDSGLAKMNAYDPRTFTASLTEVRVSKASCDQRKGRSGRTQPGVCFRLYTRQDYERRDLFTPEEIFRTDLAEVVLRMAELGIRDFEGFDFLSPPERDSIAGAVETLRTLDALTDERELSETGRLMAAFPILPRLSRIIVEAIRVYPDVLDEVLTAVSFLSTHSVFLLPPGEELEARRAHHRFRDPWGDLVGYLRILERFRQAKSKETFCRASYLDERTLHEIANIKEQLGQIVSEMGIPITGGGNVEDYLCALATGLIQFVCARSGRGTYRSLTAERIQIHPGSVMFREDPEFIVAGEIVRTGRTYARSVSPLTRKLISRVAPALLGSRAARRRGERLPSQTEAPPVLRTSRDFTNHIKIGHEVFEIRVERGKRKTVILPWDKLQSVASSASGMPEAALRGLRGRLQYQGHELLVGTKLATIIAQVPLLPMAAGILEETPPHGPLAMPRDAATLVAWAGRLPRLCRLSGKKLGFLTLTSESDGRYSYRVSKGFRGAVAESLSALEGLADEDAVNLGPEDRRTLDEAYRRLSGLLG